MTTTSLGGKVTAKLELELGQPTAVRPGAPPPHLRHPSTFASASSAAPAPGPARRPCHRGPAAKAKARARAAAYQAVKAAASAASRGAPPLPIPSGGASPYVAASPSGGSPPSSSVSRTSSHLPLASPPGSGVGIIFSPQRSANSRNDEDSDEDDYLTEFDNFLSEFAPESPKRHTTSAVLQWPWPPCFILFSDSNDDYL